MYSQMERTSTRRSTRRRRPFLQHAVNGARHNAQQLGRDLLGAYLAIALQHIVQSVPGGVVFHE